jgi:hypothetical protein
MRSDFGSNHFFSSESSGVAERPHPHLKMPLARCHCLDVSLVREYVGTCGEYLKKVKRPFQSIPLTNLWKCSQSDWEKAYTEWGILQLYFGVVVAVFAGLLMFTTKEKIEVDGEPTTTGHIIGEVVYRIGVAYLMAHWSWFAVVRKHGCFCCLVACCECSPLLLWWGIQHMAYGVFGFIRAFSYFSVSSFAVGVVLVVLHGIYSIILFYMGLCCFKIWTPFLMEMVRGKQEGAVVGEPVAEVQDAAENNTIIGQPAHEVKLAQETMPVEGGAAVVVTQVTCKLLVA